MSQPGLMAGTQCQAVREARLRNNIMRSKPSCSRYGVARLRRKRAIWIFWKVIEVTVIRGDRREQQQRKEKDRWNVSIFTETCRKVKRIKRDFFFLFRSIIPSVHHDYQPWQNCRMW